MNDLDRWKLKVKIQFHVFKCHRIPRKNVDAFWSLGSVIDHHEKLHTNPQLRHAFDDLEGHA